MPRPKKMENRQRISLFVDAEQKAQIDRIAVRLCQPWSELVREGINMVLVKYRKQLKERTRP